MITDNVLSPEFAPGLVAEGLDLLENPSGLITRFGNLSDGTRTEPDENTYLILDHNPGGPTPGYDYGRHFLFQGHENAVISLTSRASISMWRIPIIASRF